MAVSLGSGPDDVTIQVGSNRFVGWQNVNISRSCESMPNNWSLTASAEFLQGAALAGTRPGQSCLIYIGSDLVITGKIDRRSIPIDARNHQVTLSGRGITRNLVDCSADLLNDPGIRGGQINGANALDVAAKLCKAYGITAWSAVSDLGIAIPSFQVPLGETPYQIIESVARYAGYLVYEDVFGRLVLDRIGTSQHASRFTLPGNVEAINGERSVDGRFSTYVVVYSGIDQTADLGGLANRRATILDDTLGEYRLRIIVSEQIAPTAAGQQTIDNDAIARQRANWEKARSIAPSRPLEISRKLRKLRKFRIESEAPATEFTRNFGQYREIAQREPVAVTSHGRPTGYFVSAIEFEEMQRLKAYVGRSRAVADMTREEIDQMTAGRMAPEHDHLNALLHEE
jgi:prevent-host-death family protein